jgi:small-conductance mechanosensitive channel
MDLVELRDRLEGWLSTEVFGASDLTLTVGSLVLFILTLACAIAAGSMARRLVVRALSSRRGHDAGLAYAIGRAAQYAVLGAGVIVAAQFIGIDFSRLGLMIGFLSVGIGFGLQNITSNFVSGIVLLIERPVTVGDRVSVGDTEGEIEAINIRSTIVRSLANVAIFVPNSDLITSNVVNWSHGDPRIRLSVEVGVSYGSDATSVREALLAVAERHPEVLRFPEAAVRLNQFGDSSWDMELLVWLAGPQRWRDVRSELNFAIVEEFRARGVEIPFPQRDLHFRSPLSAAISRGDQDEVAGDGA